MKYLMVALGGAFGSITRYKIGKLITNNKKRNFPFGTFIINITGAFLLGYISFKNFDTNLYIFITDGYLGAFTTFSTFMYESFTLFENNYILNAFIYIFLSLLLGITGFFIGVKINF